MKLSACAATSCQDMTVHVHFVSDLLAISDWVLWDIMKRQRGGVRQRLTSKSSQEVFASDARAVGAKSELAHLLVSQYSWGSISAVAVQQYAAAAVADGASHVDLHRT